MGVPLQGGIFGLFVVVSSLGTLILGCALTIRLFYLTRNGRIAELRRMSR
jgi:hypothetical protein